MGNEYNRFHHHHHHHHQHHNLQMHHRSTFLPMLCSRPSIKDVSLPNRSASFKEDPLSPRISCMGQVKRGNKVNGFPTSHRLTITNSKHNNSPNNHHHNNNNNFKYSKLKKLFSSKSLTPTTTTTITTTTKTNTRCRRQQVVVNASSGPRINGQDHHHLCVPDINIVDLDPPLPVIKRVHKKPESQEEEVGSLWKRRSGGAALEGLQLKLTHHPRHQNQPTTV
ncbi:cap-specific mRNA (nucleoside-2'-O-)-methyltransferase 1 [Prunus avium]|uniref:Cap-specific mRNA (Nucleoside-2'-O-)-methyltransferase 1 n=1 Tax=Prunus avium TaxID=42229 RepID=A0A6P5S9P0_PRUAV|nr:cap-specific mRNA (nucleoside-2'-O-)-methyltransferase 1 [Prunus avium]